MRKKDKEFAIQLFKNGRNRIFWGDGEFFGHEGIWDRNVNLWAVDKEV